jgi:hypothetical protein
MTSNRQSGLGGRIVGLASQPAAIRIILWQVSRCRWLRRRGRQPTLPLTAAEGDGDRWTSIMILQATSTKIDVVRKPLKNNKRVFRRR